MRAAGTQRVRIREFPLRILLETSLNHRSSKVYKVIPRGRGDGLTSRILVLCQHKNRVPGLNHFPSGPGVLLHTFLIEVSAVTVLSYDERHLLDLEFPDGLGAQVFVGDYL